MKIIERSEIDILKWDKLVENTEGKSFFSYSWYLDSVAEDWCALVDDTYSQGIALPFTIRLGVETLYTPIFLSYVELLGKGADIPFYKAIITDRFKNIFLSTKQNIFGKDSEIYVSQTIESKEFKLGSQAKRMLKKAEKEPLSVKGSLNYENILPVINSELINKFTGMNQSSLKILEQLMKSAKDRGILKSFEISEGGGIVCLEDDTQLFYLKGAVGESVKKNGGMYLALKAGVELALSNNKTFDFGGSRVPGVMKFNYNLGGKDREYFSYQNFNYPFWFLALKKIKSFMGK